MCNAHRHPPGCTCGFGGEGHRGGDTLTLRPNYSTRQKSAAFFANHGNTLLEIASNAGQSIVFPTTCWYCGMTIYLYANHDGGFAIFESLGSPWPKHYCTKSDMPTPSTLTQKQENHTPQTSNTTKWLDELPPPMLLDHLSPTARILDKYYSSPTRISEHSYLRTLLITTIKYLLTEYLKRNITIPDEAIFDFYACNLIEDRDILVIGVEIPGMLSSHHWARHPKTERPSPIMPIEIISAKHLERIKMSSAYRI